MHLIISMHLIDNQKKEIEKRKEGNIQFTTFRNICNITKPFELERGKSTVIEYN